MNFKMLKVMCEIISVTTKGSSTVCVLTHVWWHVWWCANEHELV